jgi:hypothetical protein
VGQKTLSGSCKRVEEMKVGWGSNHVQLEGLVEWKGEKVLHVHDQGVWESVRLGPHIHLKGWGLVRGINGWCVVC